jgi:hypothetical protein
MYHNDFKKYYNVPNEYVEPTRANDQQKAYHFCIEFYYQIGCKNGSECDKLHVSHDFENVRTTQGQKYEIPEDMLDPKHKVDAIVTQAPAPAPTEYSIICKKGNDCYWAVPESLISNKATFEDREVCENPDYHDTSKCRKVHVLSWIRSALESDNTYKSTAEAYNSSRVKFEEWKHDRNPNAERTEQILGSNEFKSLKEPVNPIMPPVIPPPQENKQVCRN